MKKNEYLKYILKALIEGSKNFKILFNLVFCLLVFVLLSKTSFIPSGLDINFFTQFRKTKDKDQKISSNNNNPIYHSLKNFSSKDNSQLSQSRKIVFLLVAESLGYIESIEILEKVKKELFSTVKSEIYNLKNVAYKIDEIPNIISEGGTLKTEMGFLCNFSTSQYRYTRDIYKKKLSEEQFKDCIPNIYQKNGFKTIYVHTAGLNLFARREIMPLMGFQSLFSPTESIKDENILQRSYRCATKMYCSKPDSSSYEYLTTYIDKNKKDNLFINLLTVDLHGPYRSNFLKKQKEVEIYEEKASKSIKELSNFLGTLISRNYKNTEFYIIISSDHPPTLTSLKINESKKFNNGFKIYLKK